MSVTHISAELRRKIRERAGDRCEYCLIPETATFAVHEIDHLVAEKHGGQTHVDNLGLSCALCNAFKGSDLASIDPDSGQLASLYHPRQHIWTDHFRMTEARIEGITAIGRATARLLKFNRADRLEERALLVAAGLIATRN
jgi:5-methylcytosine-specific restriction endonuclease McrA